MSIIVDIFCKNLIWCQHITGFWASVTLELHLSTRFQWWDRLRQPCYLWWHVQLWPCLPLVPWKIKTNKNFKSSSYFCLYSILNTWTAISIFMADKTATTCPFSTASPTSIFTSTTSPKKWGKFGVNIWWPYTYYFI